MDDTQLNAKMAAKCRDARVAVNKTQILKGEIVMAAGGSENFDGVETGGSGAEIDGSGGSGGLTIVNGGTVGELDGAIGGLDEAVVVFGMGEGLEANEPTGRLITDMLNVKK